MSQSSISQAMFIMGGPGSGKDYVINNILNRFNIVEVQIDQILSGAAKKILESNSNLLVNCGADLDKICLVKSMLEGYKFSHTIVSVSNKVSRERNDSRAKPMNESTRIRKWLDAEKLSSKLEETFVFSNSINLQEASSAELHNFQKQIADYLGWLIEGGLAMNVIKPATLNLKPLAKKKKIVPPNSINMRIDGSGGYSLGGLTIPEEKKIQRFSSFNKNGVK